MMKIAVAIMMFALLVIVSFQFYGVEKDTASLKARVASLRQDAASIRDENQRIGDKIKYLGQSDNLIQEIKAKFNYRLPEEKTIIVAPKEKQNH